MKYYDENKHFLKDSKIVSTLSKLPKAYENGEIAEVHDELVEIINAIEAFDYHTGNIN